MEIDFSKEINKGLKVINEKESESISNSYSLKLQIHFAYLLTFYLIFYITKLQFLC